jgi:hypothetical protein
MSQQPRPADDEPKPYKAMASLVNDLASWFQVWQRAVLLEVSGIATTRTIASPPASSRAAAAAEGDSFLTFVLCSWLCISQLMTRKCQVKLGEWIKVQSCSGVTLRSNR